MTQQAETPKYEFSDKYTYEHARKYFYKHSRGFWRRLSTWREVAMARKALVMAGNPKSVFDLPCGTGRFWGMLAEDPDRRIIVGDNSQNMIDVGMELRPKNITRQIEQNIQCSAFAVPVEDDFVECVFSIRLMHHIEKSEDRILMLKEFARISSDTIIVSLWVDGNLRANQHRRNEARKLIEKGPDRPRDRFLFERAVIEKDFTDAGLEIVGHVDFIKYYDKWRTYVLRVKKD